MDFANQYREGTSRYWHPGMSVGTGGGVEWMWGPCACPPRADVILRFTAFLTKRIATWDKHKAPTHPHIHPLSLQNSRAASGPLLPELIAKPCSVNKIRQVWEKFQTLQLSTEKGHSLDGADTQHQRL